MVVMSSLDCPYVVCVSARATFSRVLAFVLIVLVCSLNVIPLSYVTPKMVVVSLTGMGVLYSVTCGCTEYSLLKGVMSVSEDLFAETLSLLSVSQFSSSCTYC